MINFIMIIQKAILTVFFIAIALGACEEIERKNVPRSFPESVRSGLYLGLNGGFGVLAYPEIESQTVAASTLQLGYSLTSRFVLAVSLMGGSGIMRDFEDTGGDYYIGHFNVQCYQLTGMFYPFRSSSNSIKNLGLVLGFGKQFTFVKPSDPLIYEPGLIIQDLDPIGDYERLEDTTLVVTAGWTADFQLSSSFHMSLETTGNFSPNSRLPFYVNLLLGFKWF